MIDRSRSAGIGRTGSDRWDTFAFAGADQASGGERERFPRRGAVRWLGGWTFWWLAALLAFGALAYGAPQPWAQSVQHLLGALIGVAVTLRLFLQRREPVALSAVEITVMLFTVYAAVRYVTGGSEWVGRQDILNLAVCVLVVLSVGRHLPTAKHGTGLALLLIAVATGHALLALWQWQMQSRGLLFGMYRDAQYGLRVSGNYVCPNHFAGMLELALPLALALALFSGWARPLRQVLGGAVVVMAVGMAFSVSRGGWISLAAGMLVFAALAGTVARAGRRWAMGILLLGAAGAAAVWFTSDLARLRFAQMQNPEVEARVTLFRDAFKVIDLSPWLGTGPATFRYAHHLVQAPSYQTIARYTHNDYLNLVCDYGLVGGVLAAGFLVALVMTLARLRKRQASPEEAAVWLGTCAAVGAWLVHSLFDFNLHLPANAVAFAVCVALPLSHRRRFPLSLPPSRAAGWGLTAFCGVVTVYLIVVGGRSLGAQWHLMRDDRLGDTDEAQSEALCRSALKWDPNQAVAATRLGDLYRVRAALATNGEARVELGATAVAFYETARRANAYETATLRKLALTYEILRRYPEAYLVHQQALKLDPHNPVTARMLGDHYAKRGQLLLARDEYDRALSLRADADTAASRQAVQAAIDKATPRRSAP